MNRFTCKMKRTITLLATLLALSVVFSGCKQETPATEPVTEPVAVTEPVVATEPEATVATEVPEEIEIEIETFPEVDAPEVGSITYEEYLALEVEVQQAYYESFENPDAFFEWLNDAKEEYNASAETVKIFGADDHSGEVQQDEIQVEEIWSGGFLEESVEDWE